MLEPSALTLWISIPAAIILIAISVEVGYRVGRRVRRRPGHDPESLVSDLATPAVGLLGLMLAFTFAWAATRFDARRNARLDEAKALVRLFHLADFFPPADRARIRDELQRYIDLSLAATDPRSFKHAFEAREQMHDDLWRMATEMARADPHSDINAQVVSAANDLLSTHLTRAILAGSSRIPSSILVGLIAILVLTMLLLGYQIGLSSLSRSPAIVPLTLAVTMMLFLILDLDRPLEGLLRVHDQALYEVQRELKAWP